MQIGLGRHVDFYVWKKSAITFVKHVGMLYFTCHAAL